MGIDIRVEGSAGQIRASLRKHLENRDLLAPYFTERNEEEVILSITTISGSEYEVFLAADNSPFQVESGDFKGYWMKSGRALRNGIAYDELVGFHTREGNLALVATDDRIMRSTGIVDFVTVE